jgi:hypothetical protein
MNVPFLLHSKKGRTEEKALLDSRATENCMDISTAKRLGLGMQKLSRPIPIYNIDGTKNKAGALMHYTELLIQKDEQQAIQQFYLMHLGEDHTVFGLPWLKTFNPDIDWANGEMKGGKVNLRTTNRPEWAKTLNPIIKGHKIVKEQDLKEGKEVWIHLAWTEEDWVHVRKTTVAQQIAQEYQEKHKQLISLPKEYQEFSKVFSEEEAKHFPPSREDDHAINFKPRIDPTFKCKVYLTN